MAGVLLDELAWTGISAATDCCLSVPFLVGETDPGELESGGQLYRGIFGGTESVSCGVEVLALFERLVIVTGKSSGCCFILGPEVMG